MAIRKTFYKVILKVLSNGQIQDLPITIACTDIQNIENLINQNKFLYNAKGTPIQSFYIAETVYPIQWSQEKYQEELAYVDIADEDTSNMIIDNRQPRTDMLDPNMDININADGSKKRMPKVY